MIKKMIRKLLILLVVFLAGLSVSAFMLNSVTTDDRTDMNDPYLPEVMIQFGDALANRMYGYSQKMQVDFTRECVTPLDTSRAIHFVVNPYETEVEALSYEIRTSDGSKVIENRKIKNLKKADTFLVADIVVESDLRMNQEYSMQITLDTARGEVYYYTRVITRSNLNAAEYVNFVKSFYEKCMDKITADDLSSYLESSQSTGTTNFANIDIHSSLSEVSWGSLKPQMVKKGIPLIKDINETTASLSIAYQISARDNEGFTDYYDVTEFYRLRFTDTRIMLLDFNRSARQIFSPRQSSITDAGLLLGIRNKDISYLMNDDLTVIAFAQQGELWTYAPDDGKFVRVITFRRDEGSDFRDSRVEHDISIVRVGENGDVDFVLSGYMPRGNHEGYCGICAYHYNADQNVVEEKVFIPCTESHEFLKMDLGILSYVNEKNEMFLLFARKLYRVDIEDGSYEVLEEGIDPDAFAVSDTSAHAAWVIAEGSDTGKIKEIDFDTGEEHLKTPGSGELFRVLGYMNEDLIYGVMLEEDRILDANGHYSAGVRQMRFESFDGEVKKEYAREGLFIMNSVIRGSMIEFDLAEKTDGTYVVRSKDNIMNNRKAAANSIAIEFTSTSRTGTLVRLAFQDSPDASVPLIVNAKMKTAQVKKIALDTRESTSDDYYVYAKGGLDSVWNDPAKAVTRANEQVGVVLNRDQQYVWERGNKKTQVQLNLTDVPEAFKSGIWDQKTLQEGLGDTGTVLDLSGCTLENVLYEISAQRPVLARISPTESVVIIGYDEYNTWLYNPLNGDVYPYGMNDSTALFGAAGNLFLSYVEKISF